MELIPSVDKWVTVRLVKFSAENPEFGIKGSDSDVDAFLKVAKKLAEFAKTLPTSAKNPDKLISDLLDYAFAALGNRWLVPAIYYVAIREVISKTFGNDGVAKIFNCAKDVLSERMEESKPAKQAK